jgi:hypothetical protein
MSRRESWLSLRRRPDRRALYGAACLMTHHAYVRLDGDCRGFRILLLPKPPAKAGRREMERVFLALYEDQRLRRRLPGAGARIRGGGMEEARRPRAPGARRRLAAGQIAEMRALIREDEKHGVRDPEGIRLPWRARGERS